MSHLDCLGVSEIVNDYTAWLSRQPITFELSGATILWWVCTRAWGKDPKFLHFSANISYELKVLRTGSQRLLVDVSYLSLFVLILWPVWLFTLHNLFIFNLSRVEGFYIQKNPALRPPRYYGHLFLAALQKRPFLYFLVKKPSLLWPTFFGPLVTVVLNGVPLYIFFKIDFYQRICDNFINSSIQ